jgi:hypothetical protein
MEKQRLRNVLIGSDVEFFLQDKETKEIVSAEGYIKGTKWEPFQYDPENKYFASSLDNVLAETCVPPVTPEQQDKWIQNFVKALNYFNGSIPPRLCTTAIPSAFLDDKYLQTDQAKIFGCEPDYNVWTRSTNPKPSLDKMVEDGLITKEDMPKYSRLRSAGFHVHFGHEEGSNTETNEMIVKACDLVLGVPSVLMEPSNERRKLYGKAGCFRFKDYGIEYRVLSSFFASTEELIAWVFRGAKRVINMVNDGVPFDDYRPFILDAINNGNQTTALNLVNEFALETA